MDSAKASAAVQALIDAVAAAGRLVSAGGPRNGEASQAAALLTRGKFADVVRLCRPILKNDPADVLAGVCFAIAAIKLGNLRVAEKRLGDYLAQQDDDYRLRDEVAAVLALLRAHHAERREAGLDYQSGAPQAEQAAASARKIRRISNLGRPPGSILNLNWIITRHCNFTCSYCTVYNNAQPYPRLDELKAACDKIARLERPEVRVVLSGGEPTVHPDYIAFVRHLAERMPNLTALRTETNLSRTPRFYRELVAALQDRLQVLNFHASYHFEFTQPDQFLANARFLADQGIPVQIRLLAHPEHMAAVKRLTEELSARSNEKLTLILKTVRKDFGAFVDDRYTAEDLAWLAGGHGHDDVERPIAVDFEPPQEGAAAERRMFNANEMIAEGLNRFKGMGCYAGVEMLSIEANGALNPAVCFIGKPGLRPNIFRIPEIPEAFLRPLVCPFAACGCPEDIAISKAAPRKGAAGGKGARG